MSRDFLDYIAIAITIALLGFVNLYAAWNFATWLARQMPRLRAWLRPYPDDAQMQTEMLRDIPAIHAHRVECRKIEQKIADLSARGHALIRDLYGSGFTSTVETALVKSGWKVSKTTAPKNFSFHVGVAHPDSQLGG